MTELHDLIEKGNDFTRLLEVLIHGEDPNIPNYRGDTPLHLAAFKEPSQNFKANLRVARELINFRAIVDVVNNFGNTPLHFAIARRNHKMIKLILEANAKINVQDAFGNTELHYAIINCSLLEVTIPDFLCIENNSHADQAIVEQLIKYRADVNICNHNNETPLIWAVKEENFRIVKILLEEGAHHYLADIHGNTALHYALYEVKVNVKIVAELLRHGSNHAHKNRYSFTPLDMYLTRLFCASPAEEEDSKYLIKLFVFTKKNFKVTQLQQIANLCLLNHFFDCGQEVLKMKKDRITPDCTVYNIASKGFNHHISDKITPPFYVFNKVLNKLKNGEYTVYCDMIVSGFSRPYLAYKTSEIGSWLNRKGNCEAFLNFDMCYWLCYYYLSHLDMFRLMLAFSSVGSH